MFDGVVSNLPVDFQAGEENFAIDTVDAFGLLELREKGKFDLALMSCRPVIERDDSAQLEIFQKLLSNKSNMLLGIYDEDGRLREHHEYHSVFYDDYIYSV